MFWSREKDRYRGFGWVDLVPDVKRRGKLNSHEIFSLKTFLPASLQYAERRRGDVREKELEEEEEEEEEDNKAESKEG